MTRYVTNSGRPVTLEMGAFLRVIDNGRWLLPAGSEDDLTEFAVCAGVGVQRALHFIAELHPQYLEKSQGHYVLTLKGRAVLVDNNLDW